MSIKIYKSQIFRPYKIEVYGLQDNYIGTLQSYDDSFIGRVQEPKVSISEDGTQEFTCSIPRYYINPKTNEKRINPRWEDVSNGVLAENTRVLKVFVEADGEKKVFPFIVDKIIDKRDAHFSVYKEVTGSGLAFAELGKIGLKLELNSHTVETDYEKDNSIVATIDYWLDKVFPNVKDDSGKIIKWLTPWCYEICMDWSHYSDKEERLPNKIYEDAYVNGWDIINGELVPAGVTPCQEKARYINTEENSNKYNITQTLAETFGVFCIYEYKCAENGSFIKEYTDENGNIWQGRKAIFYNRAIKTDIPFMIEYQKNLQSITRTCDSSEVYTKLYVTPVESTVMTDGYVSIANTEANPLLDEFILNFDYLYEKGSINDYQKDYIANYEKELHEINATLLEQADKIEKLTIEVNEKEAEWAGYEKSISSAQEELAHYQTLRDNEVTNTPVVKDKTNTYSVIFMKGTSIAEANIRLEGAVAGSISGYKDFEYTNQWFDGSRLRMVREKKPITQGDTNIYVLTDEYGYAIGLFTHPDNLPGKEETRPVSSDDSRSIFLALQYSPKNKYISICNNFETIIAEEQKKMDEAWALVESKKAELEQIEEDQNNLLKEKELLNQKFERVLGPALREGYWTPDNYDDVGKKTEETLTIDTNSDEEKKTQFFFDTELFEEEETGYYYASKLDIAEERKTYYGYINLSNYYKNWKEENQWCDLDKLVVYLQNPSFVYTAPRDATLTAGNYYIIYNTKYYYFSLEEDLVQNDQLEAKIIIDQQTKELNFAITKNGVEISVSTEPPAKEEGQDYDIPVNVTNIFENIGSYLGEHKLFPDGGFIYSFIKVKDKAIPVLLLNDVEINYKNYTQVAYSFDENNYELFNASDIVHSSTENAFNICYPRIVIRRENVKYDADTLIIQNINAAEPLTKFEDYSVLVKDGFPYFTLKINKNASIGALLEESFKIVYQVSQANEMLYQDAKEVAKENSRPKFSYEVTVSQVPQNIESFELGQLGYISDSALGVHAAQGYINKITLDLDSPKDDGITIQNYKTKFEDLFSTITASSEAMKQNQRSYDIAASGFTGQGEISGSVLQNTLNNNKVELSFSNTRVEIDDVNGITLTNVDPYSNGVYGQVVLRGGGVFVSGTVDENNQRIWNTGITPNGINASAITTGQLDTNLIRVFAGTNMAFQWNGEGIYAYKRDEEYGYLPDTYVHYSDKGLQFLDNGFLAVDLGWNGLNINTQDGSLSLTGNDGLVVYDGENKGYNKVIKLGRFGEEDNYSYGLRLYKKAENSDKYIETLVTENNGQLWLKDYLTVGANGAGISGVNNDDINSSVRFWAGKEFDQREQAPFQVLHDGSVLATKLTIGGNSTIDGIDIKVVSKTTELAAIQDGQVVVAEGKVIANSILAEAVTAEKIKAGAIESDKIASNFILDISGERAINIGTGGSLTVESNNFNIDDEGNVTLTGTITAENGKIGGWTIDEYGLYSGSEDTYVSLNSNGSGDNANYAIWAGDEDPTKAPFRVERSGIITLTSLRVLQTDSEEATTGNEKIINLYNQPFWAIWPAYRGAISSYDAAAGTITTYGGTTITFKTAASVTAELSWSGSGLTVSLSNNKTYSASYTYQGIEGGTWQNKGNHQYELVGGQVVIVGNPGGVINKSSLSGINFNGSSIYNSGWNNCIDTAYNSGTTALVLFNTVSSQLYYANGQPFEGGTLYYGGAKQTRYLLPAKK